jgi:hypothetical protein
LTSRQGFFEAVRLHADSERLLSDDHFTVDGSLLEAWAGQNTNDTHQSTTDPDARLYKKARGREAHLGYLGQVLMEHRSGLIAQATVTPADGHGARDAALVMLERLPGQHSVTLAGERG